MKILQHPEPTLRLKAHPVVDFSEVPEIVAAMKAAASPAFLPRALGLAANQVGILKRIIIVNQGGPWIALINPVIVRSEGEQRLREGCLSIGFGREYLVRTRPLFIVVEYQDETGKPCRRKAKGLNAAVICHEVDHLEGVLMMDKPAAEAA